jgi:hypothetical protein
MKRNDLNYTKLTRKLVKDKERRDKTESRDHALYAMGHRPEPIDLETMIYMTKLLASKKVERE